MDLKEDIARKYEEVIDEKEKTKKEETIKIYKTLRYATFGEENINTMMARKKAEDKKRLYLDPFPKVRYKVLLAVLEKKKYKIFKHGCYDKVSIKKLTERKYKPFFPKFKISHVYWSYNKKYNVYMEW